MSKQLKRSTKTTKHSKRSKHKSYRRKYRKYYGGVSADIYLTVNDLLENVGNLLYEYIGMDIDKSYIISIDEDTDTIHLSIFQNGMGHYTKKISEVINNPKYALDELTLRNRYGL